MKELTLKYSKRLMILGLAMVLVSGIYNALYVDFSVETSAFDNHNFKLKKQRVVKRARKKYSKKRVVARAGYSKKRKKIVRKAVENSRAEISSSHQKAHIQHELNLSLKEFFNPKLYKKVLKSDQAIGSLAARDGVIETFEVSLPNGEEIVGQFSEMNGNVFTYDHEGHLYSGLIYQSGNSAYSVTLVNGPFKGSKMKFTSANNNESYGRSLSNEDDSYEQMLKAEKKELEQMEKERVQAENFPQNDKDQDHNPQEQA